MIKKSGQKQKELLILNKKYFPLFLKGFHWSNEITPRASAMAGIVQNGQKCLIFIVVSQIRAKMREKGKQGNKSWEYIYIYIYIYI